MSGYCYECVKDGKCKLQDDGVYSCATGDGFERWELTIKLDKEQSKILLNSLGTHLDALERASKEIKSNVIEDVLRKEFRSTNALRELLDVQINPRNELPF